VGYILHLLIQTFGDELMDQLLRHILNRRLWTYGPIITTTISFTKTLLIIIRIITPLPPQTQNYLSTSWNY
jgi:hypothetical protein